MSISQLSSPPAYFFKLTCDWTQFLLRPHFVSLSLSSSLLAPWWSCFQYLYHCYGSYVHSCSTIRIHSQWFHFSHQNNHNCNTDTADCRRQNSNCRCICYTKMLVVMLNFYPSTLNEILDAQFIKGKHCTVLDPLCWPKICHQKPSKGKNPHKTCSRHTSTSIDTYLLDMILRWTWIFAVKPASGAFSSIRPRAEVLEAIVLFIFAGGG